MTVFLRLLGESDKASALVGACNRLRQGESDSRRFEVLSEEFRSLPGKPFAYWVSTQFRDVFKRFPPFEGLERTAKQGLATADDFRFLRLWWESRGPSWLGFAKGGSFSPYYADVHLTVNWRKGGAEIRNFFSRETGKLYSRPQNIEYFCRPGLTWPIKNRFSFKPRALPANCAFAHVGPSAFVKNDEANSILALQGLLSSQVFTELIRLMAGWNYEVGVVQKAPIPVLDSGLSTRLANLSRRAWSLTRTLDTIEETSHAFVLPAALRGSQDGYDPAAIETELTCIQTEIDTIAFDLYGISESDRVATQIGSTVIGNEAESDDAEDEDEDGVAPIDRTTSLLSWAVGVAFGRFDWRLANGQRVVPSEPEPFDPLPAKSPGMLPADVMSLYTHPGMLVDEPGHPHDLVHLIEEVLVRVDAPIPPEVRRWLQREFFPFHLQRYSKSRRKAPIYWPLATSSGSYTLWLYYPDLTSQTLYTAINDIVEPKLEQVGKELAVLRDKGTARSRDDDKLVEVLQTLERELAELRDILLQIAPTYHPNHDDGVHITAAPLWPLFRHKPWQKLLKETWEKLNKGDYDWSHLAMAYWPDRVREKCKTDKSLAIAHGLEALYEPPPESTTRPGRGGRKRRGVAP